MNQKFQRSAAGVFEQKFSKEMFLALRCKVLKLRAEDESMNWRAIADRLVQDPAYKAIAKKTLGDYVVIVGKPTEKLFKRYADGEISFSILSELAQGDLSDPDRELLADLTVVKNSKLREDLRLDPKRAMTSSEIAKVKAYLRDGCLMAEAIRRASGQMPEREQQSDAKQAEQLISEKMVSEAVKAVQDAIFRMRMLVDVLPFSLFDKGRIHAKIFTMTWSARYAVKDLYEQLDTQARKYWDEILQYNNLVNRGSENRKENIDGGSRNEGEAGVGDRRAAREAVPQPEGVDQGEGREQSNVPDRAPGGA